MITATSVMASRLHLPALTMMRRSLIPLVGSSAASYHKHPRPSRPVTPGHPIQLDAIEVVHLDHKAPRLRTRPATVVPQMSTRMP